jgi:hypothetical protein
MGQTAFRPNFAEWRANRQWCENTLPSLTRTDSPRAYRSKCDGLTDTLRRDHCFRTEQDDSFKDTDGVPDRM